MKFHEMLKQVKAQQAALNPPPPDPLGPLVPASNFAVDRKVKVRALPLPGLKEFGRWPSGLTGKVVGHDGDVVLVKLDGVSARWLRFRSNEIELI